MRRACADETLSALELRSTGRDTGSKWLRKCRRALPASSKPIGQRSRMRQTLADSIIQSVTAGAEKSTVTPVHVVLGAETDVTDETEASHPATNEAKNATSRGTKTTAPLADTTITLPGGTVLRIGEERPDQSKPGRKRKGELVIKEVVESKRPTRTRKFPARFKRSPDKKSIELALKRSRKNAELKRRLNVERIQVVSSQPSMVAAVSQVTSVIQPKQIKIESAPESEVTKVHGAPMHNGSIVNGQTVTIAQPTLTSTLVTSRKLSADESKSGEGDVGGASVSDNGHGGGQSQVATVITVNPSGHVGQHSVSQLALIQPAGGAQHGAVMTQSTPTIVVAQPITSSRKSQPSTPFLMNDILKSSSSSTSSSANAAASSNQKQQHEVTSTRQVSYSPAQHVTRPPVIAPNVRAASSQSVAAHRKHDIQGLSGRGDASRGVAHRGQVGRPPSDKIIQPVHQRYQQRPQLTPPDRRTMVSTPTHSPIQTPRQQVSQHRQPQTIILPQIPVCSRSLNNIIASKTKKTSYKKTKIGILDEPSQLRSRDSHEHGRSQPIARPPDPAVGLTKYRRQKQPHQFNHLSAGSLRKLEYLAFCIVKSW